MATIFIKVKYLKLFSLIMLMASFTNNINAGARAIRSGVNVGRLAGQNVARAESEAVAQQIGRATKNIAVRGPVQVAGRAGTTAGNVGKTAFGEIRAVEGVGRKAPSPGAGIPGSGAAKKMNPLESAISKMTPAQESFAFAAAATLAAGAVAGGGIALERKRQEEEEAAQELNNAVEALTADELDAVAAEKENAAKAAEVALKAAQDAKDNADKIAALQKSQASAEAEAARTRKAAEIMKFRATLAEKEAEEARLKAEQDAARRAGKEAYMIQAQAERDKALGIIGSAKEFYTKAANLTTDALEKITGISNEALTKDLANIAIKNQESFDTNTKTEADANSIVNTSL